MVDIQKIVRADQWDPLVRQHGGHPLQLWGWGETKAKYGWTAHRYLITNEGQFLGAAQVLIRTMPWPISGFAYIPRGPVVPDHDHVHTVLDALVTELKRNRPVRHGIVALSIEPDTESWPGVPGWSHAKNEILPSETIRLDLTHPVHELQSAMSKKTRQYIRKSAGDLDGIRSGTEADLDACFAIYRDTAERANFALRSEAYYRDVFALLGNHNQLFLAESGGEPVAFLWNAHSDAVAFELYGGMSAQGQELRANFALKWHAIQAAQSEGLRAYDMGGLIGGGVSTFKRSWTDGDTHLVGTIDYPLSPLYGAYSSLLPSAKKMIKKLMPGR